MLVLPPRHRPILQLVGAMLIPLALYFTLLALPISPDLSHYFRSGNPLLVLALILLWYPAWKRSGWIGELASLSLTMIVFAMPLSWVWNTAFVDGNTIGGVLPWNDARQYFMDAQRLLVGEPFSAFASRRPLFAGLLSLALVLTGHSLQWTLAIFGAITALACYFLARAIRETDGPLAGVIVLTFVFLYYRFLIHRLLTEHLGLPLGALGFAFLWLGAHRQKRWSVLAGILLLTLGLNARAGAFFILPMLILWAAWYYRGERWFSRWFLAGCVAAVALGFGLNMLVLRVVGARDGRAFSNFSYTLYGLAAGYKGWDQIYKDVPGVKEEQVMSYALALIRSNPRGLLTGIRLAYRDFVNVQGYNAFEFAHFHYAPAGFRTYGALLLIGALGLVWALLNFKTWRGSLLLALAVGVFLSIPFIPPIDAESMRVYAVTMPLNGLVVAAGVLAPARWFKWGGGEPNLPQDVTGLLLAPFAAALVVIMLVGPLAVYGLGRFPEISSQALDCPAGSHRLTVYVSQGNMLHLVDSPEMAQSHFPTARLDEFRARLPAHAFKPMVAELEKLPAGTSLLMSLNYQPNAATGLENVLLIGERDRLSRQNGWADICARPSPSADLDGYLFYYAVSQPGTAAFTPPLTTQAQVQQATLLAAGLIALVVLEPSWQLFRSLIFKKLWVYVGRLHRPT